MIRPETLQEKSKRLYEKMALARDVFEEGIMEEVIDDVTALSIGAIANAVARRGADPREVIEQISGRRRAVLLKRQGNVERPETSIGDWRSTFDESEKCINDNAASSFSPATDPYPQTRTGLGAFFFDLKGFFARPRFQKMAVCIEALLIVAWMIHAGLHSSLLTPENIFRAPEKPERSGLAVPRTNPDDSADRKIKTLRDALKNLDDFDNAKVARRPSKPLRDTLDTMLREQSFNGRAQSRSPSDGGDLDSIALTGTMFWGADYAAQPGKPEAPISSWPMTVGGEPHRLAVPYVAKALLDPTEKLWPAGSARSNRLLLVDSQYPAIHQFRRASRESLRLANLRLQVLTAQIQLEKSDAENWLNLLSDYFALGDYSVLPAIVREARLSLTEYPTQLEHFDALAKPIVQDAIYKDAIYREAKIYVSCSTPWKPIFSQPDRC
jgi:hypothetical protein